jgi:hypothetical protein
MIEPQLMQVIEMVKGLQEAQTNAQGSNAALVGPATLGPEIFQGEVLAALDILKQMKTLEIELKISKESIRLDSTVEALPGTDLAKVITSPAPSTRELLQILPSKGAMRGATTYNSAASTALMQNTANRVLDAMDVGEEGRVAVQNWLEMVSMYQGGYAMDALQPGDSLLNMAGVYYVEDPEKARKIIQEMPEKMAPMMKLYEEMGMKIKFDIAMDAREHKGIPIHAFQFDFDVEKMPPEAQKILEIIIGKSFKYDMAIVKDKLLFAMGSEPIEGLIDAAQANAYPGSKKLQAETVFGPGGQAYFDFDVASLLKIGADFTKANLGAENPVTNVLAAIAPALEGAAPVMAAGFWGEGNQARMSLDIPSALITKIAQSGDAIANAALGGGSADPRDSITTAAPVEKVDAGQTAQTVSKVKSDLRNLAGALEAYYIDDNKYPTSLSALSGKIKYIAEIPTDPFSPAEHAYQYEQRGKKWKIWSIGPDKVNNLAYVVYNPANGPASPGDIVRTQAGLSEPK